MSAIAGYLESEGVATTGISLVREHTEQMAPPRFLWVPFPLGRPLGVPGDAAFQHRVIEAALALLDAPSGPVLRDLDIALPEGASEPWSCPVSFSAPVDPALSTNELGRQLLAELALLEPWYARVLARRGRTTVCARPNTLPEVFVALIGFVNDTPDASGLSPRDIKRMVEDLRAYYLEAAAAQPASDEQAMNTWFWHDTHAGQLVLAVREAGLSHPRPSMRAMAAGALVPRRVLEGR